MTVGRAAGWLLALASTLGLGIGSAPSQVTSPAPLAHAAARTAPGRLEIVGGQRLLHVQGSPRARGLQHGRRLREEVQRGLRAFLDYAADRGLGRDRLLATFARMRPHIPEGYLEEMAGLAEGAGISLKTVHAAHMIPAHFHCSGAAVWGRATADHKLYHTRSLDYAINIGGSERAVQESALTLVIRPDQGHAHVVVGWAGFVGCVSGMNEAGISVGEMGSRSRDETEDGLPMVFLLREVLVKSRTLEQAVRIFQESPRTAGYNFIVADGNQPAAVALEVNRSRVAVFHPGDDRTPPHFPIADTVRRVNHFVDPVLAATQRDPYDPRQSSRASWLFYQTLSSFLRQRHGRITETTMVDQLRLYPPRTPCLHQAVFCPTDRAFWVSHATSPGRTRLPGAQNRPFYRFDLPALLRGEPAAKHVQILESPVAPPPLPWPETDHVGPLNSESTASDVPDGFTFKEPGFTCTLRPEGRYAGVTEWAIAFPSPDPANGSAGPAPSDRVDDTPDRVQGTYFQPPGPGPFPGVVVLHALNTRRVFARFVAERLALRGVAAVALDLPGYGSRKPLARGQGEWRWIRRPETVQRFFCQAVRDGRRTVTWLAERPEVDAHRLGMTGVSLGGVVAALTMAVEPRLARGAFVLAGGDLAGSVLTARAPGPAAALIRDAGLTDARLHQLLDPLDPLTYASRLRGRPTLWVNAAFDQVVPPDATRALASAAGAARIHWVPAGHYTATAWLPWVTTRLAEHFLSGSVRHLFETARVVAAEGPRIVHPASGQASDPRHRVLDSAGFLIAVLDRTAEVQALPEDTRVALRRGIQVNPGRPRSAEENQALEQSLAEKTPAVRGAAHALARAGLGRECKNDEPIQAGDVLQWWERSGDSSWIGRSALVDRVFEQSDRQVRLRLYGSHPVVGGVGFFARAFQREKDHLFACRLRGP